MEEKLDLTAYQVKQIATNNPEIQKILADKKQAQTELAELMLSVNALHKLIVILDSDLHKACLRAKPSQILTITQTKKLSDIRAAKLQASVAGLSKEQIAALVKKHLSK